MKGRTVVLDHLNDREAAALIVDGVLEDFLIEGDAPTPGTIYRARADRPVKGQGGMFLTTPDGPAFLRQVKGLAPGQMMLVQVTGYAEEGKAIPVTQKLLFKSRYAIVTPDAPGLNISRSIRNEDERDRLLEVAHESTGDLPYGLILRSACAGADVEDIAEDIVAMCNLAEQVLNDDGDTPEVLSEGDGPHLLAWRDWVEPASIESTKGGFERHGVLDALDVAQDIREPLSGGAFLYVEPTRAFVAVDVNTGSDTSLAAGIKANMACAKQLPRVLRVRGLGGQIILDLAPMPKKDRRAFESALRASLKADSEETTMLGWTNLGHFELQRKRGRISLTEALA
ncbi:ribonuclease G [Epibacterium sp. SM1979]|uniref:Ribonuclease G n=1 Tax=Tritonibacter litoralis TaxID=2662264 RepID=A0A843YLY8_9RHOB|nr:ribonuclease E/G [Tritonibacter litoralis]MQQ10262.1 ribonuclease G [Tritonibacter litoralis]